MMPLGTCPGIRFQTIMPLRRYLRVASSALLLAHLSAQQPQAPDAPPAPPASLRRDIPTHGWHHARNGGTGILSRLSAEETKLHLEDFLIFQNFVRAHFPEAALPADWPLIVVVSHSTNTYRAFGGKEQRTSSTLPGSRHFILIDGAESGAIEQSIRRRYVELAFEQHPVDRYPLWRQWGTREILSRTLVGREQLQLGILHSSAFTPGQMIDLGRLLALTPDSPEAALRADGSSGPAYHQAMMFMHMCLFGSARYHRELREPFQRFTARLETEPLSEGLFHECFGMDYAEMHAVLRGYMSGSPIPRFEIQRYRFGTTASVAVHAASPEEVMVVLEQARALLAADFAAESEP